jgi:hypothetical protein
VSGVIKASATPHIEHGTPHVQTVGGRQACHILQYAPFHGLVADSPLKLDMQHERTTIGQRNVEDLVSSEHAAGQFHVERMGFTYVGMQ